MKKHNATFLTIFALGLLSAIAPASQAQAAAFPTFDMEFPLGSSSMEPTFAKGDVLAVTHYGVGRLPHRGDVVVFHVPGKIGDLYVKRIIALPGDTVSYTNKRLSLNGKPIAESAEGHVQASDGSEYYKFAERLGATSFEVVVNPQAPSYVVGGPDPFPHRSQCQYTAVGVTCHVPANDYWVLGDNLDNSLDSRYFGFVPSGNIVGKVVSVMRVGE